MTQLTPAQINLLRSRPQSTHLYLSIYQPKTIFACQVTGTYNQGSNPIYYSNVTTGSWWQIYPNMVARIGETPGGDELGELRVRSATGTYIDFAENEVVWQNGLYLTLIDYVDISPIYPRLIQDPNNQTNVIFYKDYDIPYSNQNTIYGTFPCAGPHRAGFIVTGAYSTYWSSTGSYNVKGDSLTYSWAFEGGTPTGSTAKDPGFVRYTTPGHYKTRLIITSSSGAVDTTYRYVSAYQRPENGTFNPIEAWEMSELSGSRGEGGYTARIKIMSILPELEPKALIVIWAEDTYGGTPVSLGGNSQNNESIVFVGYVLKNSIRFNYQESTMEFDVGSPSELMKETEGFSVSCESKASATTWYELTEMTTQKAMYHYLRWHSTVLNVTDFQYTGDDRYVQYFDSDRTSLFDAIDSFVRNGLLGALVNDRQGKLWAEINSYGLEEPFADIPTNPLNLNKQDWMGDPTIQESRGTNMSFVELGGIAYYGTASNTFSALIADAPGLTPLYRGNTERHEGLILLSQEQLNQVAANYLAYRNTQYSEVMLPINGNYRNIDIAPLEKFYLVISRDDTIRNASLWGRPYVPSSMTWRYSPTQQSFYPELTLEQMATGTMAETVAIPITPPFTDSGFDYPSLQLPPFPVFNPPYQVGAATPLTVLLHDVTSGPQTGKGWLFSDTFDSTNPQYITVNGGLTSTQYAGSNGFGFVTPNGAFYVGRISLTGAEGFVARAPAIGQPFTIIYDSNNLNIGGGGAYGVCAAGFNPEQPESVALVLKFSNADPHVFYYGAGTSFTAGNTVDTGNFTGDLSFGLSKWLYTSFSKFATLSTSGVIATTGTPSIQIVHVRGSSTSGRTYSVRNDGSFNWTIGENNFATSSTLTDSNLRMQGMAVAISPDGMQLMARYNNGGSRGKSSDGASTWAQLPSLPFASNYVWAYAGMGGTSATTSRWIAAGSIVRFSPDFGTTWLNKEGNITTIQAVPNIDMIFVPGITQKVARVL